MAYRALGKQTGGANDLENIALVQKAYNGHVASCAICDASIPDGLRCYAALALLQAIHTLEDAMTFRLVVAMSSPFMYLINDDYSSAVIDDEGFGIADGDELGDCSGDCDDCPGCGV